MNDNILIAEFIGRRGKVHDWLFWTNIPGVKWVESKELLFHYSWDWLMPVVRKIVEICIDDGELFESPYYTSILETIPLAIIEDSHKVVVEFINYYNKNKEEDYINRYRTKRIDKKIRARGNKTT
jgi:hypothetical protein